MALWKKQAGSEPEQLAVERPGAKNRPTPRRREQEAARRRPLVADGKAATAEQKERRKAERARAREGMMRGEDKYLAARDRGSERRFLRDAVDRRWNIGEVLLPIMVVILAVTLVRNPAVSMFAFFAAYGVMFFGVIDSVLLWRRTKRAYTEAYHHEPPKGSVMYLLLRSFQMRMSRVPRPSVERGTPLVRH